MLEIKGNIWDQQCDWLCITTNGIIKNNGCAVMGAGVALQAKNIYKDIDIKLAKSIKEKGNVVSSLHFDKQKNIWLISFPTKNHWKDKSDIKLIEESARSLKKHFDNYNDKNGRKPIVILPRPGCKNGGLSWEYRVKPIIEKILVDDRFVVFSL